MPNKTIKIVRYRSLGLPKSGATLCFLEAPYLNRYVVYVPDQSTNQLTMTENKL